MEAAYRRIAVAAKNIDTREHDIADSDDYFQYHGGMVATVRALTGASPAAYVGDSTNPSSVRTRTLHEETARVFRARVVNPRWMQAMRRHGYKGAFEMAATVDYLFGYDATTGVVADWMYEKLTESYVLDPVNREFLAESNPWALHGMAERLLEAVDRGLWEAPDPATLDALRQTYLETEGDLEGVTRTVYVIGIGAGDPEHLTLQAVAAMNRVDVFFTIDKGEATAELAALRKLLLDRHVTRPHRVVTAPEVPRDRDPSAYVDTAVDWQARRAALYERMVTDELADGEAGGFLVWGDPSLYDGTLNLLRDVAGRTGIEIVSIPGISSVAALAAAHGLILNRVGTPVLITTGRRLAEQGVPRDVDDVVVMLDGRTAFADLPDADLDIFWGAYLGTPDEILVAGDLRAVRDQIARLRTEARARKGWIMDIYLLRRRR